MTGSQTTLTAGTGGTVNSLSRRLATVESLATATGLVSRDFCVVFSYAADDDHHSSRTLSRIAMINVSRVLDLHETTVRVWHEQPISLGATGIYGLIEQQHEFNYRLWHQEDIARCPNASDEEIATVKRAIDKLNQNRNDWIEKVDEWIVGDVAEQRISPAKEARMNTETPGSVIDRLSILSLRIYHLNEQLLREEAGEELLLSVENKVAVANLQKEHLSTSLEQLLEDIYSGAKRHQTYRQMKMYNDPRLNPYLIAAAQGRKQVA